MFARWMHNREYIQLLLNWRWLVLAIAVPISLVIELLEGQGEDLHLLDEVLLDGLVLPITTWIILTFAARKMAVQFEREAELERRQQFIARLAGHREYESLAHFLTRFPFSVLPVQHVLLDVFDTGHSRLGPVESVGPGSASDSLIRSYVVLIHDSVQVGSLQLSFTRGREPTAAQMDQFATFVPDMAAALARIIDDHRQAEQAYREARAYERRRITQELHDSLAQQVFYLHIGLDQLAEDTALSKSEAVQQKLSTMRVVAADVYEQIRNNLSILRAWEQVNLTEAITDLARISARNADMTIDIDVTGEPAWLSPHACEQIYSVVREALNNIARHARAKHVQVALAWSPTLLVIRLVDDGVGFDPQRPPAEGHYGLALMRETIDALHGELIIESSAGNGTSLQVTLPLDLQVTELNPLHTWPRQIHAALIGNP